jgi:hypothetical protein
MKRFYEMADKTDKGKSKQNSPTGSVASAGRSARSAHDQYQG